VTSKNGLPIAVPLVLVNVAVMWNLSARVSVATSPKGDQVIEHQVGCAITRAAAFDVVVGISRTRINPVADTSRSVSATYTSIGALSKEGRDSDAAAVRYCADEHTQTEHFEPVRPPASSAHTRAGSPHREEYGKAEDRRPRKPIRGET
jgi:hypothetical protein